MDSHGRRKNPLSDRLVDYLSKEIAKQRFSNEGMWSHPRAHLYCADTLDPAVINLPQLTLAPGITGREYPNLYSEASVIAVNGDRDHPRKLKIREAAAPL